MWIVWWGINDMKILVVTGGIGSGKSVVCSVLSSLGFKWQYNADSRVKRLYDECPLLLDAVEKVVGIPLRNEAGVFVPALLAGRIFSDDNLLSAVEDLVFDALEKDFSSFLDTVPSSVEYVVFESATILEKSRFKGFGDIVVLVDAPMEVRMERACKRDSASRESVLSRMKKQLLMNSVSSAKEPDLGSIGVDYLLKNDVSEDVLRRRVAEMVTELGLVPDNIEN